jgi:hypothetical protein
MFVTKGGGRRKKFWEAGELYCEVAYASILCQAKHNNSQIGVD